MKHIKQPVILTTDQAEVVFNSTVSILQWVETAEVLRPGDPFPVWTLQCVADKIMDAINETGSFIFEDAD
jgi:hypothetical protein